MADGFFKGINDSEAGQLLSLAANATGVAGVAIQLVSGAISLLSGSEGDTDVVLNAVNKLRQDLQLEIAQLGDLIQKQTQIIVEHENTLAVASAISHTNTAIDKLARFARLKEVADLQAADTESDLGAQFFLALPKEPPDPFFLPGLAKSGAARVLVLAARDPGMHDADDARQINELADRLSGLVDIVKQNVDEAHVLRADDVQTVVGQDSDPEHDGDTPILEDHFSWVHLSHLAEIERFPVNSLGPDEEGFDLATRARFAGVIAELQFLSIPDFQSTIDSWRKVAQL